MALTFGSLFSGIGGLDLGLERAGLECKWQVENDDYATRVLAKHWPDVRRWNDVRTFPPDADRESESTIAIDAEERGRYPGLAGWRVDLIAAGFPCQDISYAGRGAGLSGERSGLFHEAARVVRLLRPRYVCFENVAALRTRGLDQVLGTLSAIGYDAEWHCIPAAATGAPHIRDRVFILANAQGDGRGSRRTRGTAGPGARQEDETEVARQRPIFRSKPCRVGWWDVEPAVGRVAHGVPSRVDRLRGLGNAVAVPVGEYIGEQILAYAKRVRELKQRKKP